MVRDKVRIRFRKGGTLRLVSHHDLMRCFERMLRRAALPYHSTEGFNPKPRLIFALSLGLGIIGCQEVVELELDEELPEEEIHKRLSGQCPEGLAIQSVKRIVTNAQAQVRRVCYRIPLPNTSCEGIQERILTLLSRPNCWIERTRPLARRLDLRPYIRAITLLPGSLEMDLLVTPNGTARPDEILELLGLRDLLPAGAVLERTILELVDEYSEAEGNPGEEKSSPFAAVASLAPPINSPNGAKIDSLRDQGTSPFPENILEGNA
jgi:radical SAM-linked protein